MKELDEHRLFEGSRKWKIGIAFGIVFFFLLMSSVFFVMLCLTGLPLGQSGFAKYQDAIVILGMTTAANSNQDEHPSKQQYQRFLPFPDRFSIQIATPKDNSHEGNTTT